MLIVLFIQPDNNISLMLIGACVCDGGGEYWIVNGHFTVLLDASSLKVLLCNKVLVFLPLPYHFPMPNSMTPFSPPYLLPRDFWPLRQ